MLTTSGDVLDTLGTTDAPEHFIVCLGCSTWNSEQLQQEIAQNMWIYSESNNKTLFNTGYLDRWLEANEMMGISSGVLGSAGRA